MLIFLHVLALVINIFPLCPMIIQGTCEVLKQLKKVNARTSVQMERMRREQVAIEIAKKPGIGADPSKQTRANIILLQ